MNANREEVVFALALAELATESELTGKGQTSVNPKQALRRWMSARRRNVPTLPRRRYSRSFSTRYIRSHFTSVSQSSPSAPFSTNSCSRAGRLAFWLEPINTLTNGARATRSGWLTTIAGCGPASAKSHLPPDVDDEHFDDEEVVEEEPEEEHWDEEPDEELDEEEGEDGHAPVHPKKRHPRKDHDDEFEEEDIEYDDEEEDDDEEDEEEDDDDSHDR